MALICPALAKSRGVVTDLKMSSCRDSEFSERTVALGSLGGDGVSSPLQIAINGSYPHGRQCQKIARTLEEKVAKAPHMFAHGKAGKVSMTSLWTIQEGLRKTHRKGDGRRQALVDVAKARYVVRCGDHLGSFIF